MLNIFTLILSFVIYSILPEIYYVQSYFLRYLKIFIPLFPKNNTNFQRKLKLDLLQVYVVPYPEMNSTVIHGISIKLIFIEKWEFR